MAGKAKKTVNYNAPTNTLSAAGVAATLLIQVDEHDLDAMTRMLYDSLKNDINEGLLLPKEKIQLFAKLLDIKFPKAQHINISGNLSDEAKTLAEHLSLLADDSEQ